jgi:hypothetical protein
MVTSLLRGLMDRGRPGHHLLGINKWAAGIADTLVLGLLCEAPGRGLPVVVLPYLNAAQAEHPALAESIERLRRVGVRVLFGPDVLPLHRPRQEKRDRYPWHLILPAIKEAAPAEAPDRQDFRNSLP